eukprot:Skav222994  [mRNA]  locus=scaffold1827:276678:279843:- [translate_table: standard]
MMTPHFAFCVCILLVLQPLRAFRGNQESNVESAAQAATLLPDSSQAEKVEDLEKQVAELKLEDDHKAEEITNLKEEIKVVSERMDVLEGRLPNPLEAKKQMLKVAKNYQNAFDIVYGMQLDTALDLLEESQNENLKGLVVDLQKLPKKKHQKVTAQTQSNDAFRSSPLSVAAQHGLLDLAEAFIRKGANLEAKDPEGWTPLFWAAYNGHVKVAELLIRKGAKVEAKANNDSTPLHWAAYWGRDKVVELLIQKGANVNAKMKKGSTPLSIAADFKRDKVVKLLKVAGARQ